MSACPSDAAHIRGVWALKCVVRRTSAPAASSERTRASLPVRAAVIRMVSPPARTASGSAPARSRASAISALALRAASASGVTPRSFAAFASAPASSSTRAVSKSFQCTAQCRAVAPSGLPGIDGGRVRQQGPHGPLIAPLGRVGERRVLGGRSSRAGQDRKRRCQPDGRRPRACCAETRS